MMIQNLIPNLVMNLRVNLMKHEIIERLKTKKNRVRKTC